MFDFTDLENANLDFHPNQDGHDKIAAVIYGALPDNGSQTIMLGASGMKDPTENTDTKGKFYTPNSYIYFGVNGSGPIKWRVLDADSANDNRTDGMFLLSEYLLESGVYFQQSYHYDSDSRNNHKGSVPSDGDHSNCQIANDWQGSDTQAWCENFVSNSSNFSTAEQSAMLGVAKTDSAESLYGISWDESGLTTDDKMFFLSVRELANYVGDYDNAPGLTATFVDGSAGVWWLRSPYANTIAAGAVSSYDYVFFYNVYRDWAARPAFNLDLNSLLFTSAAAGGKPEGGLQAISDYKGDEWKLTLLDSSRNFSISNVTKNSSGDTIAFSYSGAQTGTNEYISVVIVDNGAITHYGRILQLDGTTNKASGTASLTLPAGVTLDNDTKLYVYNEQYNGDYHTDYAGQLIEVVNPTVDDTTPYLSNGSATRDSETAATVKFTSDEAGTCYYIAQDTEITLTKEQIAAQGTQQACKVGENEIKLNNITASVWYVVVVAQDAVGNISDILYLTIPAYITPVYEISADTQLLPFGTVTEGYTEAPAAKEVTITNTGNQTVTVTLPTSANYTIAAGTGFENGTATLAQQGKATFSVRPKTELGVGDYSDTLTISGSNSTSANISLSFEVLETYTLTVNLNGGSGSTTGGEYTEGEEISIDTGTKSGYRFTGWTSSDGGSFADASSASTTFTMPAADTTITAHWEHTGSSGGGGGTSGGGGGGISTYSITAKETAHGTVTVSPQRATPGSTVTVTAAPDQGYQLDTLTVTDSKGSEVKLNEREEGKFTFTMPASPVTVEAVFVPIPEEPEQPDPLPFTDVAENAWYYDGVAYVYEKGLMTGTSSTTFAPETTTSRAMIATILWRMAGSPQVDYAMDFADVAQGQWYSEAVRWAASEGIVDGYGNGTFGTDDPITREQFAAMLYRYARQQGYDVSVGENTNILSYTDVADLAEYAIPAMQWAVGTGIINGTGDGSPLTPQGQATRAQAAVMLQRFCEEYVIW